MMFSGMTRIYALIAISVVFCTGAKAYTPLSTLKVQPRSIDGIHFALNVVWDGIPVELRALRKIETFRKTFPSLPIIHQISPQYFTSFDRTQAFSKNISSVFRPTDKIGIYLSGWKEYVEKSGIEPILDNSFWGKKHPLNCKQCGDDIPVTLYADEDLARMIEWGVSKIESLDLGKVKTSFVAGWHGDDRVLYYLAQNNVQSDFSMISPIKVSHSIGFYPIYERLLDIWGYKETDRASRLINFGEKNIFQIANNFGSPSVIKTDTALDLLKRMHNKIKRGMITGSPIVVSLFTSNATKDVQFIEEFTKHLIRESHKNFIPLHFMSQNSIFFHQATENYAKARGHWNWPNPK